MLRNKGVWYGLACALVAVTAGACVTPMQAFLATTSDTPLATPAWTCSSTANQTTQPTHGNAYCPNDGSGHWPADRTNFVGTSGGSDVNGNNFADSSHPFWQTTINANSAQNFEVVASYPMDPNGVQTYPSAEAVNYGGSATSEVSTLQKLTSSWNESFPHNSLVSAHFMQDDWFASPTQLAGSSCGTAQGGFCNEMMVQVDFSNDFPNNSCSESGTGEWSIIAAGVTFPSVTDQNGQSSSATQTWYLCDGSDPRFNPNPSACPYSSGTTTDGWHCVMEWKPGTVTLVSPNHWKVTQAPDNISNGVVNLQAMEQYLETHNQPSGQPDFPANAQITHLSVGWEILGTGGSTTPYQTAPQTFVGDGYQIDCIPATGPGHDCT